eukprot:261605_1
MRQANVDVMVPSTELYDVMNTEDTKKRMKRWQLIVVITVALCYACNYFTRNQIYVTTNSFKSYLDPNNPDNAHKWMSIMFTFGQFGYFLSKLIVSFLMDTKIHSGVQPLVCGMVLVPIMTAIIALFNIEHYTYRIIFCITMYTFICAAQSPLWSGVMKLTSNWIDYQYYGRVMSFMSLSYLAGDAITRWIFAYILSIDEFNNWRSIFYFASAIAIVAVIPLLLIVRDSPIQRGLPLPQQNPNNVYSECNKHDKYQSVEDLGQTQSTCTSWILMKPLLRDMMFYFIILFNLFLSSLRFFFNMYCVDYLSSQIGASSSMAALISGLFPAMGIAAAPLNGIWIDVMLKRKKNVLRYMLFPIQGIMFTVPIVIIWYDQYQQMDISLHFASLLILTAGFGILGCYSMLYVLILDLSGNKSPTIVSGLADCVGFIGSMSMSFLAGFFDYQFLFALLGAIGVAFVITSICLVLYTSCKQ